jgi:DNA-binding CsgD family transcriptional regulator
MRLRKIDPERIPALIASGLSATEIADEFGCTEGSLRVRCSQLKISLRRISLPGLRPGAAGSGSYQTVATHYSPVPQNAASRSKRLRKIDPQQIPLLLDRGLTSAQIAAEFGCTLGTLRVKCSRLQISLRRRPKTVDEEFQSEPGRPSPAPGPSPKGTALSRLAASSDRPVLSRTNRSLDIALPADTIDQLRQRGAAMGVSAAALAASLLETISRDCLYSAVLDAD